MQNLKRRIIGVVILLVMICAVMVIPQIKAEEAPTATETVTPLSCEQLVDKYGLYIEATGNPDEFRLIKDPAIKCEDGKVHSDVSVKIISVNGTAVTTGITLTKDNNNHVFKAGFLGPINGNTYYVSVIVENVANPDEKIEVQYLEEREAAGTGTVGSYFKEKYEIISNDLLYFSYVLQKGLIELNYIPTFDKLIEYKNKKEKIEIDNIYDYLNNLNPEEYNGEKCIAERYSPICDRMYLTEKMH